ncbi:hypothetical protein MCB86_03750 [Pseudomonas sp. KSR10]|nr:hypothetical protein [Pseudomonas sp. KSR10]
MGVVYRSYDETGRLLMRETGSVCKVIGSFPVTTASGSITVSIPLAGTVFFFITPRLGSGGTYVGSRPVVEYDGNGVFSWLFAGTDAAGAYDVHYGVY